MKSSLRTSTQILWLPRLLPQRLQPLSGRGSCGGAAYGTAGCSRGFRRLKEETLRYINENIDCLTPTEKRFCCFAVTGQNLNAFRGKFVGINSKHLEDRAGPLEQESVVPCGQKTSKVNT